ncbi:MAG: sulfate adenylyltransferase subunit CysN [Planctomycetes bacterium]|nr:sulfate adenylyltransferase subunit CysN [Planctomycetota bacterium]
MSSYKELELLRFSTAVSVDDGKSTLIGRLLYDTKTIFEDQIKSVQETCDRKGLQELDLALFTDGLAAEREQGITIDVAYRYFSTPKRKFIIADTPGHEQYTRNMVTGASTSNLAIILIDARKGVLIQSKRHAFISSLLGIPHVVVAINKMDLVDYDEDIYNSIRNDFVDFSSKMNIPDLSFIPVSALKGDNVVDRGENMPWYDGYTLLSYLENINIGADRNLIDFRFPVQSVIRPNQDYRGYAGVVESGVVRKGEEIVVLPSGIKSTIKAIDTFDGELDYAFAPQSVTLLLEDEVDISRGDTIVRPNNIPAVGRDFEAMICWMSEDPFDVNKKYIFKHTTQSFKGKVNELYYRIDMNTLHRQKTSALMLNEMGRVSVRTQKPLFYDSYDRNRATGHFIMIDEMNNNTVAAGMIMTKPTDISELPPEDTGV